MKVIALLTASLVSLSAGLTAGVTGPALLGWSEHTAGPFSDAPIIGGSGTMDSTDEGGSGDTEKSVDNMTQQKRQERMDWAEQQRVQQAPPPLGEPAKPNLTDFKVEAFWPAVRSIELSIEAWRGVLDGYDGNVSEEDYNDVKAMVEGGLWGYRFLHHTRLPDGWNHTYELTKEILVDIQRSMRHLMVYEEYGLEWDEVNQTFDRAVDGYRTLVEEGRLDDMPDDVEPFDKYVMVVPDGSGPSD